MLSSQNKGFIYYHYSYWTNDRILKKKVQKRSLYEEKYERNVIKEEEEEVEYIKIDEEKRGSRKYFHLPCYSCVQVPFM